MRHAAFAFALVLLVACEAARPPLSRAQIAGYADALCVREGREWGEATGVSLPDGADADGHAWWQVRYADGPDGAVRAVLVDGDTRWARFPGPGEQVRVAVPSVEAAWDERRLARGSWVLCLTPEPQPVSERAALEAQVAALNVDARNSALAPAFALREARDGLSIVWGWQDDHGTVRNEAARDWVRRRTTYADPIWIDLAP